MWAYELQEFGIDGLRLTEQADPHPEAGEVVVKFRAASLNYRDLMVVEGTYNPRMKLPAIPFSDAAGEVVAVGGGVTKWKPGDKVCSLLIPGWVSGEPTAETSRTAIGAGAGPGVLRECAAVPENAVIAMPEHLSYAEGSTLPCAALTAWNALQVSGRIKQGDTVLALGTGGVSIFALQFAKLAGARVIITSGSDEKLARAAELGADETINYITVPDWEKAVLELTGGKGVDHVIEVGGAGTLPRSIKAVRVGGHIAMIGALDNEGGFNPIPLFMKAVRLQGIFVGSTEMFEAMNRRITETELHPVIDRVFEAGEVHSALEYMRSGGHFGKIVIDYSKGGLQ
jgi:NADPH:quinone reductase-like Zn-dependent oxidoreductase